MTERVVAITGLGTVSAAGRGRGELEETFRRSEVHLAPVDCSAGYHRPRRAAPEELSRALEAALVNGADLRPWLPPLEARRMSPPSKLAVVAARMAVADAGLEMARLSEDGATAVVVSTAFGPSSFTEQILRQIWLENPEAVSPFLFTESVANAPAAQIALASGARGPNVTITQREAGPLLALARGAADVAAGRVRRALVASVEELNPLLHAVLERFKALAPVARPFDRRRSGFVPAEGATVVVLEPLAEVVARGGRPLAVLRRSGSAFDPDAPVAGWGRDPRALAASVGQGLRAAGLEPEDLGAVVTSACGSKGGDRLEALLLRRLWGGDPLPPVLAPKAVTGEHGGALLAAAVLAAAGAEFGPTPGFEEVDPELEVIPHAGGPLPPPPRILATAPAVGGAFAWTVLERGTP